MQLTFVWWFATADDGQYYWEDDDNTPADADYDDYDIHIPIISNCVIKTNTLISNISALVFILVLF